MEKKEITCICCPLGCRITVEMEGNEIKDIQGYTCKRGETYARKEVTSPTRVVTSTVKVRNGEKQQVSVKTASDIPKDKIFECMKEINKMIVDAPISIGDVIIENVCGTGVPIVATKNVDSL